MARRWGTSALGYQHPGFHVFCSNHISPDYETAMENLARYIIRASFSQESVHDLDQEGKVARDLTRALFFT